jgi:hypothetical protein
MIRQRRRVVSVLRGAKIDRMFTRRAFPHCRSMHDGTRPLACADMSALSRVATKVT